MEEKVKSQLKIKMKYQFAVSVKVWKSMHVILMEKKKKNYALYIEKLKRVQLI